MRWLTGLAAFLAMTFSMQVQAALIISTYTGVVSEGTDNAGDFGPAGGNLAGDSFVAVNAWSPSAGGVINKTSGGLTADSLFGGTDFVAVPQGSPHTVTFIDGQVTATFTVAVLDNNQVQGNRNFTVTLVDPLGGAALARRAAPGGTASAHCSRCGCGCR